MKLGEQLDELRLNILRDRSDLIAGDTDSLWTDETLLRYIREGERRWARETMIIRDGTSAEYCNIRLRTGVRDYPLNELVIAVISARESGKDYDLRRSGHSLVQAVQPPSVLEFDPIYGATLPPGAPLAYYTDETLVFAQQTRVTASIYPLPDADHNGTIVNLRVIRLPKGGYTLNDLDRESDVPEDYQLDPLQWAAFRAQSTFDGDAGAPGTAAEHKTAFDDAVKRAIKEAKRTMYVATGLGTGRNGFVWTR